MPLRSAADHHNVMEDRCHVRMTILPVSEQDMGSDRNRINTAIVCRSFAEDETVCSYMAENDSGSPIPASHSSRMWKRLPELTKVEQAAMAIGASRVRGERDASSLDLERATDGSARNDKTER